MKGIQNTSTDTYRKLMGNGLVYEIPKFQRDYSWDTEQWDDLWQDLKALSAEEPGEHYMGYLVLQSSNNKSFKVIDGQQRLTTLSIMILTVLKCLQELAEKGIEPERNLERKKVLMNNYVGYTDPVTLLTNNKLKLNRNNDAYYRNYLAPLLNLPLRNTHVSEKLMRSCFLWFYDRVKKEFATGEAFASFVDSLVDKLFFTVIQVSDELNEFRVFETLNARGVQLSSSDLLKNHLFSVVDADKPHESEINDLELLWGDVIGKLGSGKFPEFLRIYWNSLNKTVRKTDLFKAIRKNINTKGEAFALTRELNSIADLYMALQDPDDELWAQHKDISTYLRILELFQVKQPLPLLIAAFTILDIDTFKRILKACLVISMRYNVIGGRNPNDQETVYNAAALKIRKNKVFVIVYLKEIYPDDDVFESEFSSKAFKNTSRNHKILKYIFAELEKQTYRVDINRDSELYTIEHIIPEAGGDSWIYLGDDVLERCVYRIGNTTLLEKNLNRDIGNESFEKKKDAYGKSSIKLTQEIAQNTEWSEESITKRQETLAKSAKTIWRLQF